MAFSLSLALAAVSFLITTVTLVEADWKSDIVKYINGLDDGTCKKRLLINENQYLGSAACANLKMQKVQLIEGYHCSDVVLDHLIGITCERSDWTSEVLETADAVGGKCKTVLIKFVDLEGSDTQSDACVWIKNNKKMILDEKEVYGVLLPTACTEDTYNHVVNTVCG